MANKKKKNKKSFSKVLLIQESILVWIITLVFLGLSFYCILSGYTGELPWLSTMVAFPWAAYGVSAAYYYKKSTKENTKGGIIYDQAFGSVEEEEEEYLDEEE
jgi:positive regulator of sigma E activity